MNTLIARSILAASVAFAMPLAANAAQAPAPVVAVVSATDAALGGPIQLNAVTIQPSSGWQNNFAYSGLTTIAFTNTSSVPVTRIVFTLHGNQGQIIGHITDAGNYVHGQTVRHTFVNNEIDPQQSLNVEEATFADGSVWSNAQPAAPVSFRQAR